MFIQAASGDKRLYPEKAFYGRSSSAGGSYSEKNISGFTGIIIDCGAERRG
jgi:hypothetical protein